MKIMNRKIFLIESLVKRIKKNNLKEVIIATSATVEGQTTAHYIEDTIKDDKLKITKLAQGLPVGGEIEQLDDGTLFSAFKNRVPVTGKLIRRLFFLIFFDVIKVQYSQKAELFP